MLPGAVLLIVGSGVLTPLRPGASAVNWVIGEVLASASTRFGSSLPLLAVQDTLSCSRNIRLQLQGVDSDVIINAGATDLRNLMLSQLYERELQLCNMTLT